MTDQHLHTREELACDVCGNWPDENGCIEHGKGCFTQSEDGGGFSFVSEEKYIEGGVVKKFGESID